MRNLTIPVAFGSSSTSSRIFTGPTHTLGTYNAAYGDTWSSLAGTSSPGLDRSASPTKTVRRSKDDLDLQRPAFQRTYPSRRKLTVSHGAGASLPSQGSIASGLDHRPSFPPSGRLDVKGKGKESGLASSNDALDVIREGDGAVTIDGTGLEGLETDESDLIFGWTSANRLPAPLVRSKSKSSLKSSSSRRSISSSVSKRLFKQDKRHRNSLNGSDEDEDSDTSENDSTRKASSSRYERPQSPLSPHVSFRMASQHDPTFTAGLSQHVEGDLPASISAAARRARSASRGSILSVASGSSASTIRASGLTRHSEKEERFLRLKRYEDVRSHLVRSRLTLSLLQEQGSTAATLSGTPRPPITRTRTISLPIRGESAEANARSGPAGHMGSATFYISEPHKRSMEPSFPLDFSARATMLGGTAAPCHIHTLIARIWVQTDPESVETGSDDSDWKLLLEWEVDLRKLISLGTDVCQACTAGSKASDTCFFTASPVSPQTATQHPHLQSFEHR